MPEKLKIKYHELCKNVDFFYSIMDSWNSYLIMNPNCTQEEMLKMLENIKEQEPELYHAMQEDINNGEYSKNM